MEYASLWLRPRVHSLKLKAVSKKKSETKLEGLSILILASTVFYILGKKRYFAA